MAGRTVDVQITGTSAQLKAALAEAGLAADEAATGIGDKFDSASTKAGGAFSKLGQTLENITGIPVGAAFEKTGSSIEGANTKGMNFGDTLASIGGAAGIGAAVAVGAIAVEAVKLGDQFNKTETTIAANANISVAAAKKIGDAFLNTAGTTIYSGQEIGTAYAAVAGQLGTMQGHALNASQAMTVMKAAMDLAEGSSTSLGSATSSLVSVLQTFHLGIGQSTTASDILFSTARALGTSVDSVASSFTRLRGQLGAASPPLKDLGGLMVDLAEHGEANSRAMRSVTTSLSSLLTPSKSATDAQRFLGVSFADAHGNMLPMRDIIGELNPIIDHMGVAQATTTLKALGFGTASAKLVSTIDAGVPAFDKATKAVSATGAAHAAAEKQSKTLGHETELLGSTFKDLETKLGTALIPTITKVIAAIGQAVSEIITHWPEVAKVVDEVMKVVDPTLKAMEQMFKGMTKVIGGLISFVVDVFQGKWGKAWDDVKKVLSGLVDFIKGFLKTFIAPFEQLFPAMKNIFESIWHAIDKVWSDVANDTHAAWSAIINFFTGIPGQIAHVWSDIVNAIHGAWSAISGWVMSNVIMPVVNFYESIPGRVAHVWNDVVNAIHNIWSAISGWVMSNIIQPVVTFYESIPGRIAHVWSDVVSGIQNIWSTISGWVNSNVVQPVISFYASIPGRITGIASQVWNNFTSGVSSLASWIDSNVVEPIVNFFTGIPGKLVGIGKTIVSTIVREISGAGGDILNAIKGIIPGPLQGAVGAVLGFLAEGGPAMANMPYIIGEAGPELFVPNTSGIVVPNSVLTKPTPIGTPLSVSSALAGGGAGGSTSIANSSSSQSVQQNINVFAQTNANANDIATETAWALKTAPRV